MKRSLCLLCVFCLANHLAATENSPAPTQQKTEPISKETPINPELKRALDLASLTMDAFVLTTCASLEKCEYSRGYSACLLDIRLDALRCMNSDYAKSLLCHLYVWFEKTEQLLHDAFNKKQNIIKVPTLDFTTQEIEIKLDEQIKRIHDGESSVKTIQNGISRFFPFNTATKQQS